MGTYRVRDKATGRVISIPWDDPNSRPTDDDISSFIDQQQGPSIQEINAAPDISFDEEPSLISKAGSFLTKINPVTPGRNPLEVIPGALGQIRKPVDDAATFYSGKAAGNRALQYGPRIGAGELAVSAAGLNPELNPEAEREHPYRTAITRPLVGTLATAGTDPTLVAGSLKGIAPAARVVDRALAGIGAIQGAESAIESGGGAFKEIRENGMSPRALELLINAGMGAGFGYLGYRGARGVSLGKNAPEPEINLKNDGPDSPIGFQKTYETSQVETHPFSSLEEIDNLMKQGTASGRGAATYDAVPELESSITNDRPPVIYDADGNPYPVTTKDYGPRVREALLPERETPEIDLSQVSNFDSPDINPIRRGYLADEAARDYHAAREPIINLEEMEPAPRVPPDLDIRLDNFNERMNPPRGDGPTLIVPGEDAGRIEPVRDLDLLSEQVEPKELITDIPPEITGERFPLNDKQVGEMLWQEAPKEAEALSRESFKPRKGRKRDFERWLAAKEKRALARLRQTNSAEIGGFQRISDIATVVAARGARIVARDFDTWREQLPPDLQSLSEPTLRMAYGIIQAGSRAGSAVPDREEGLVLPPDFIRSVDEAKGGGKEPPPPPINLSNDGGGEIPLEPRESGSDQRGVRDAIRDFTMSTGSQIKREGPAGADLYNLLTKTRLDYESTAGQWQRRFNEAIAPLNKEQFDQFVDHMDQGTRSKDQGINQALDIVKQLDDEVVTRATNSGMGFRTASGTKQVPFKGRQGGYWPHIFGEEFFKNQNSAIDSLMKAYETKEGKPLSRREAEIMFRNARAFGERLISAQHQRKGNLGGWRRDAGAYLKHLDDMARRTTEAEQLGPLDIGSPSSRISKLIEQTTNPDLVYRNVKRILKRDRDHDEAANKLVRNTANVMAWANLSNFVLGNFNQNAMIPLRSSTKAFLSSVANVMKGKSKAEALDSGALQTLAGEILLEEGKSSKMTKLYGMDFSERLNRSISSGAGRGTAIELFNILKKNPKAAKVRQQFEDLLLEDADQILKQDKLTDEQLNRAGGRMSEITQGRAQPLDLPYHWTGSPYMQLVLLFKKYAFRQTRMIADAIKANPSRNIPAALILFQAMGELTGDAKAAISGLSSAALTGDDPEQKIREKISERGDWIGSDSPILNRVLANYSQSWFLGLLGDILEKGSKKEAIIEFAGGPVLSQGAEVVSGTVQAAKGNPKPLAKTLGSKVPVIGSGVRQAIQNSDLDEAEYPNLEDIPIEELERLFQ